MQFTVPAPFSLILHCFIVPLKFLRFVYHRLFYKLLRLYFHSEKRHAVLVKISSVRELVLGAPLKVILKHLASKTVAPNVDSFVALVHRPKESYFVIPQVQYFLS